MTEHSNISQFDSSSEELSMDDALLRDLRAVIDENLKNEQFSVEDLAETIALSRSHLHRKLNKLTGRSISQFIRAHRLEKAMDLLMKDVATVSEIAYRVGFGSPTYFIKCFHEEYGYSPGEVKKRITEDPPSQEEQETTKPKNDPASPTPLESLHPATSEVLIMELFEELIKFKPSLEKFLMVDEDEGEQVDIRLLAYQIIKSYPWPIGVELRRLFSGALQKADQQRQVQLNKAIQRNVTFLAFLLISELVEHIIRDNMRMEAEFKLTTRNCIEHPTAKNLIWLLSNVKKQMEKNAVPYFLQEIEAALDDSLFREMEDWLTLIDSKDENFEETCQSLEQTLILLLKKSAFLAKYKLVNIGSILVKKPKFKQASFEHTIHLLNSTDSEFRVHQEILERFADSNAVLLMKSIKDPDSFLNLSPLIIDTHNEKSQSRIPLKKDIYFFNGFEGEAMTYLGTEMTQPSDLSQLPKYEDLKTEYQDLLNLISK